MNTNKLANGLRQLGEAVYEIADALLDTAIDTPEAGRAPLPPARSEAASPPGVAPATFSDGTPIDEPYQG